MHFSTYLKSHMMCSLNTCNGNWRLRMQIQNAIWSNDCTLLAQDCHQSPFWDTKGHSIPGTHLQSIQIWNKEIILSFGPSHINSNIELKLHVYFPVKQYYQPYINMNILNPLKISAITSMFCTLKRVARRGCRGLKLWQIDIAHL